MALAQQVLVLAHLVGFAALLGGVLAQLRTAEPEVTGAMLVGAWTELVTGVALVVLLLVGPGEVSWWPTVVKTVVTSFVLLLVVRNRRFLSVPRGLLLLVGGLTLLSAAVSVLWP